MPIEWELRSGNMMFAYVGENTFSVILWDTNRYQIFALFGPGESDPYTYFASEWYDVVGLVNIMMEKGEPL